MRRRALPDEPSAAEQIREEKRRKVMQSKSIARHRFPIALLADLVCCLVDAVSGGGGVLLVVIIISSINVIL